jgi:LPXTG-motif cell wall-anchored protein
MGAAAAAAAMAAAVILSAPPAAVAAGDDAESALVTMTPELAKKVQNHVESFRARYGISGMSVAVVTPDPGDPTGTTPVVTTFSVGTPSLDSAEPVTASTQFEIASETKIFTADLLAHLVATGAVSLDDRVQQFAPPGVTVPVWTDPETGETTHITLRDLATHQAGLTDLPGNFADGCGDEVDCANWRPGYTRTMLWDSLASGSLLWKPGTDWLYSNWGFGLLGTVLADVVDPSVPVEEPPAYQAALESTFLGALGMTSTVLGTGPAIATPYTSENAPTFYWDDTNALAGEGGLVSTATDMSTFVEAHLGYLPQDAPAGVRTMADTLKPVSAITTVCSEPGSCQASDFRMGLGWQLHSASASDMGTEWAFKNGGTAGFASDTVLAPAKRVGVTTMWNQNRVGSAEPGIELLGLILHEKPASRPDHGGGEHGGGEHGRGEHGRGEHGRGAEHDEARLADTGQETSPVGWRAAGAAGLLLLLLGAAVVARRRRNAL